MTTWLRYFSFWRRDPRTDARDEIRFHLDMRVRELTGRGMTAHEARRVAEREFGDAQHVQRQVERIDERMRRREQRAEWFGDFARDVRVGLRSLRNAPAFTVTAVLCAGLGIGVTAAIVSAANAILVRPLPYADADRLVAVYGENTERGYKRSNISWYDYAAWRDENRAFTAIGIWTWDSHTLSDGANDAERIEGARVSANLFQTLGVLPALGRLFVPGEDGERAQRVVLLGDALWRRRFGADPSIIGKPITVDGAAWTVVGVMKPRFNFPDRGELWTPFEDNRSTTGRGNRFTAGAIGRVKAGVTVDQARADLYRIDAELARLFPDANEGWRADVIPLRDDLVGDLRRPLEVFLWAVGLVLLMVCANVANLMLARGATRSRELAVRSALGASRARLSRQLLTESLLVAGCGALIGVLVAWWGVRLLRFAFPNQTPPFFITLSLDGATVLIVLTTALLTGLLFGMIPALRGTKVDLNSALRDGTRGAGEGLHRSRLRAALVVGEVSLSVVLMIGALLLVRSYRNLAGTDLGFEQRGILSARLSLPATDYPTRAHSLAFYERLMDRLRHLPGVVAVGSAQGIPFSGWNVQGGVEIEGAPPMNRGEEIVSHYQVVTPDYFKVIGVPLVRGRWLTAADRDSTASTILVNETFAKKVFKDADPIGRRVRVAGDLATIVGVVRDYRHYRLPEAMGPAAFFPYATWPGRVQTIVLRVSDERCERGGACDAGALVPALRAATRELDPRLALYQVQTFEEAVSRSMWRQRLQGNVLSIFAALALALACIGLYGVVSYAVAQRTRELGVRIALGATRRDVAMLVFGQSGKLVAAGVVVGLAAAFFGVRILETLLYGVASKDLATFASVPAVLAAVALLAAIIPARRATRVNPIIAMRAE
jgi:putative ABC transport system permease protein